MEHIYKELKDEEFAMAVEEVLILQEKGIWPHNAPMKDRLISQIQDVTQQYFSQAMAVHKSCLMRELMERYLKLVRETYDNEIL